MRRCTIALLLVLSFVPSTGCGYGTISPRASDYAQALYGVCSREAADRLSGVRQQIEQEIAAGTLAERDASWLLGILEQAESGAWDDAQADCRRLMEAQIKS